MRVAKILFAAVVLTLLAACEKPKPGQNGQGLHGGQSEPVLVVAEADLPGYFKTWDNAITACQSELGEGWRLPTAEEALCMCRDRGEVVYRVDGMYWTSDQQGDTATVVWFGVLGDCNHQNADKKYSQPVRCVKTEYRQARKL